MLKTCNLRLVSSHKKEREWERTEEAGLRLHVFSVWAYIVFWSFLDILTFLKCFWSIMNFFLALKVATKSLNIAQISSGFLINLDPIVHSKRQQNYHRKLALTHIHSNCKILDEDKKIHQENPQEVKGNPLLKSRKFLSWPWYFGIVIHSSGFRAYSTLSLSSGRLRHFENLSSTLFFAILLLLFFWGNTLIKVYCLIIAKLVCYWYLILDLEGFASAFCKETWPEDYRTHCSQ